MRITQSKIIAISHVQSGQKWQERNDCKSPNFLGTFLNVFGGATLGDSQILHMKHGGVTWSILESFLKWNITKKAHQRSFCPFLFAILSWECLNIFITSGKNCYHFPWEAEFFLIRFSKVEDFLPFSVSCYPIMFVSRHFMSKVCGVRSFSLNRGKCKILLQNIFRCFCFVDPQEMGVSAQYPCQ